MINRELIRLKVVQVLYSSMIKGEQSKTKILNELDKSLDKSYELYNSLLRLIVELTNLEEQELDEAKHKYFPTEEDLNPNTKFVDNRLVSVLRNDTTLYNYVEEKHITWTDNIIFLKLILNKIKNSSIYADYMQSTESSLNDDIELWRSLFKSVIFVDDDFLEELENRSVYWNDDLDIVGQFVLKSIRRVEEDDAQFVLPMFKNDEDKEFAVQLLTKTLEQTDDNNLIINNFVEEEKWEPERIAMMDRLVMNVALTEVKSFPSIPVNVTMNEYIEIAKCYSTSSSGPFVNGLLHAAITSLKQNHQLIK